MLHIRKSHAVFRTALLLSTIVVPVTAIAQSGSFAGDDAQDMSSQILAFPAPIYDSPAISAPVQTLGVTEGYSVRGATAMNQSLAGTINSILPESVTLNPAGADESFVTIGQLNQSPKRQPLPDDIDPEQAAELTEEIDPEQAAELGGAQQVPSLGKFIVHYPVAFREIPVSKFADVTAFVSEAGDIQSLRKRNLPTSLDTETASVNGDTALANAVANAGSWAESATVGGPELEVWVDESGAGLLSYRIELTDNGAEPMARRYWVSASGDGQVIYWENMIRNQHFGNVKGTVWTDAGTPTGPTSSEPLSDMRITRSTGGSTFTNADGNYAFPTGGGVATMTGNLSGKRSVINNVAGPVMTRSRNGSTTIAADLNLNATGAEQLAQATAYYWTNQAYELASDILAPGDLPGLATNVNRPGSCNAFWNGTSINFYVAGGSCPNMAYDSVVLHEYGHGVDARKGGIVNGGYSEGFGDAMSILGTRGSCVGQDFFGPNTCLRDAKDLIMWPFAPGDGVHSQGRRYAGFTWELTQQLKTLYADDTAFEVARQLVMGAAKANPSDIPDAVKLSFLVDDDDNDLSNGTPHFKQLAAAADSRNIPRPADPINNVRRVGFAWANNPSSANYTPSTTYAYNSSNGPISARRLSLGNYEVKFVGLGGQGRAGGNVQVTGYGSSANFCKVYYWSSGGTDFRARVRCFNPSGSLVDDRFTILITWP